MPIEERREQLLDAAIDIIARDGYDGLSVDAIAREAGVTRPVVYGAYDGLGPLLYALLDRQQTRALAQVFEILPPEPDLSDADGFMMDVVEGLMKRIIDDPVTWRPILQTQHGTPDAVRDRIEADRQLIREQIAVLVKEGLKQRGGPDLDAEVMAHLLLITIEHFGRLLLQDEPPFPPERLSKALRTLLDALRPTR